MRSMIIATALFSVALAACGGPYQLSNEERTVTELGAREYADRSQADYVACSGQDSDRDGYVTCTTKNRVAPNTQSEILCAYKSRGCKRKV